MTSDPHEPETPHRRRGAWGCLIGLVVVVALGFGAFFFLQGPITALIDRFQPAEDFEGTGTGEVVFMIHEGDTGSSIAENLVAEDIVASPEAFTEVLAEADPTPIFYPGAYLMAEQMSAQSALDALLDPSNKLENTFVIPGGHRHRRCACRSSPRARVSPSKSCRPPRPSRRRTRAAGRGHVTRGVPVPGDVHRRPRYHGIRW